MPTTEVSVSTSFSADAAVMANKSAIKTWLPFADSYYKVNVLHAADEKKSCFVFFLLCQQLAECHFTFPVKLGVWTLTAGVGTKQLARDDLDERNSFCKD